MNPVDTDYHDAELGNGNLFTLSIDTSEADNLVLLVDDGTTDSSPAQYSLTERIVVDYFSEPMYLREFTGETARSWQMDATKQSHEFTFENTSGGPAHYRVFTYSY